MIFYGYLSSAKGAALVLNNPDIKTSFVENMVT